MYNWFFFKIYDFYKSRKNYDPVFNTALLVFFAQGVHLFLIFAAFKYFFGFQLPKFSDDSSTNKIAFLPISLLWMILVYFFYKNKVKDLEVKYKPAPLKLYKLLLLLILVIVVPLYFCIKLSGGQVWK